MANNRMYLKCNGCGKAIFLGRHYGQPWTIDKNLDEIHSFFRRHWECMLPQDKPFWLSTHGSDFSLVYENQNIGEFEPEYHGEPPEYVKEEIKEYEDRMNREVEPPEEPEKVPKSKIMFFVNSGGKEFDIMSKVETELKLLGGEPKLMPFDILVGGSSVTYLCFTLTEDIFDKCLEYIKNLPNAGGIIDGEGNIYESNN